MRKIKQYHLVRAENIDVFNKAVNESLANGWELYGFPVVGRGGKYASNVYAQALVVYSKPGLSKRKS
jgi:hypothetical protein